MRSLCTVDVHKIILLVFTATYTYPFTHKYHNLNHKPGTDHDDNRLLLPPITLQQDGFTSHLSINVIFIAIRILLIPHSPRQSKRWCILGPYFLCAEAYDMQALPTSNICRRIMVNPLIEILHMRALLYELGICILNANDASLVRE